MSTASKARKSYRGVAQFGRAPRSGRGGRKFESCRLDEDEIPGNVEKSRFPGVFLCENTAGNLVNGIQKSI